MTKEIPEVPTSRNDDEDTKRIMNRLKRLEGQIRGLQSMMDSDKSCDAVLTQVMAAKSALNQVGLLIIAHSMRDCVRESKTDNVDEALDQALGMLLKYVNLPET